MSLLRNANLKQSHATRTKATHTHTHTQTQIQTQTHAHRHRHRHTHCVEAPFMIVLPLMTISPMVRPSLGTGFRVDGSITSRYSNLTPMSRSRGEAWYLESRRKVRLSQVRNSKQRTPCRAKKPAFSSMDFEFHSSFHSHITPVRVHGPVWYCTPLKHKCKRHKAS